MTTETLITFFGWLTVVNFGILLVAGIAILLMQDWMAGLHERMLGLPATEARRVYFGWLGSYKMLTLVFCFAPWLALQIAF